MPGGEESAFRIGEDWAIVYTANESGPHLQRRITTFRRIGGGATYRRTEEVHRLRLWHTREIDKMLREARFRVQIRRGYGGRALAPGHRVFVARAAYGVPSVEVDGLEIAYRRAGVGPPLVLVHGGASDGREWTPQLQGLAGELTVIAWDEPGSGRSADLPPGFGLADFADVLAGLIAALGLGRAHVGGLSWGGVVVQELYRRHPECVATLILADTYAGWKGSLPPEEVEARVASALGDLEAPPEEFKANLPGLFAADPSPEVAALVAEIERDVRPAGFRTCIKAVAGADHRDLLPWIAVPTLLLWGVDDARSPIDTVGRQFQDAIPHAELIGIPSAGHWSSLERPAEFNEAVLDFCRRHAPG